jgi:hypothetical protein
MRTLLLLVTIVAVAAGAAAAGLVWMVATRPVTVAELVRRLW